MKNRKELSVIVPCYNLCAWGVILDRCIKSLVHQDIAAEAYEVLLIDDGSTDDTGAICDSYAAKYSQVQVVHQHNGGLSAARNTGLSIAQGKYVYFVDGDDFVAENCFKLLIDTANTHNLDLLMFDYIKVHTDSPKPSPFSHESTEIKVMSADDYLSANFLMGSVCMSIFKRSIIESEHLQFPVRRMYEDNAFMLQAILSSQRLAKINKVCYYYWLRPGSITSNRSLNHRIKLIDDIIFCGINFGKILEKYRNEISDTSYNRLNSRREYFFYQALLFGTECDSLHIIIPKLRQANALPLSRLDKRDYSVRKWEIFRILSHWPKLLCAASKMLALALRLKEKVKKRE